MLFARLTDMMQFGINLGRPAVIQMTKVALGASAAAALIFTAVAAHAQLAPPAPKAQPVAPAAPAAKAPAAPAAPAAAAKAPVKKAAAPTSACQGLDEKSCSAKATDCRWIAAVKRKDGKEQSAHCRGVPKSVKAAPKKTDPAAKPAPAKAAAPATPAAPSAATRAAPATPSAPAVKAPAAATK